MTDFLRGGQAFGVGRGAEIIDTSEAKRYSDSAYGAGSSPKQVLADQPLSDQLGDIEKLVNEALTIVGQSADRLFGSRPEPGHSSGGIGGGGHVSDRLCELNATVRRLLNQAQRLNRIG